MRLPFLMMFAAFLTGRPAALGEDPIKLEIAIGKDRFPFRGSIPLTITYTNTSRDTLELLANGLAAGEGFAGETFEVTCGAGKKSYTVAAIDPEVKRVTLKPGQQWKRTIKELVVELCRCDIDGKAPTGDDPLPDPFGRLDEYTLRLRYASTIRDQPKPAFNGRIYSNTVKFSVVR